MPEIIFNITLRFAVWPFIQNLYTTKIHPWPFKWLKYVLYTYKKNKAHILQKMQSDSGDLEQQSWKQGDDNTWKWLQILTYLTVLKSVKWDTDKIV